MSHLVICPHCSKQIHVPDWNTHKTLFCPRCLADVGNPRSGSQIRATDINTDVKRDMNVSSIVLAVLLGLCVCGIVMASRFAYLVYFGVMPVLVLAAIIRLAWKGTSGTAVSTAGRVVSVLFIVLGTIVAFAIFVFVACAMAFRGPYH